jgi:uncharacterized protein
MTSPTSPGGPVASPCNSVCTMDPVTGLCAGCFRTLDEIAAWSLLDDAGRRAVWVALASRRAALASHPVASDPSRADTDAKR